jgi:hypothetical protein
VNLQTPPNTEAAHPMMSAPVIEVHGKSYLRDAKGTLVPLEAIKPVDKLMDETVRTMMVHARQLSAQIARFKGHCFDDVGSLLALLEQNYQAKPGGKKGNMTFTSFDGCLKVQVQVADNITFGPELNAAKSLVDECLNEWGAESRAELRAVINRAFQVDREGKINRAELFMLMRTEIDDTRWQNAMQAIRDSIRVIGSKTYIRFYERSSPDDGWEPVSIDLAQVS